MASLSERLRRERELRGISLQQIAQETKITVRFLEALEDDRLEMIPGEFYRRSYLRAYARYLGLDEERALNAYAMAHAPPSVESRAERTPEEHAQPGLPNLAKSGVAVFLVSSLAAMVYLIGRMERSSASTPTIPARALDVESSGGQAPMAGAGSPVDVQTTTGSPSDRAPGADVGAEPGAVPRNVSGAGRTNVAREGLGLARGPGETSALSPRRGLEIVVSVEEPCWLQIHADGELVDSGVKERGYQLALSASRDVRLWLGNAGGVSMSLNGSPARSLGAPGEVRRDVSITPQNYRSFLLTENRP
jgi:cytoskeletal protein RodZ